MNLSEWLKSRNADKEVKIINGNYQVLYYGFPQESAIKYDCNGLWVTHEYAPDIAVVEYNC